MGRHLVFLSASNTETDLFTSKRSIAIAFFLFIVLPLGLVVLATRFIGYDEQDNKYLTFASCAAMEADYGPVTAASKLCSGEGLSEEAKMMLQDKETLQNALNAAHDARVALLDQKEDQIRSNEEKTNTAIVAEVREAEYHRNRNRVVEIWNLVRPAPPRRPTPCCLLTSARARQVHKIHKEELDRMAEVEN